jgi:uncharacterized protein (TIGR03118 family)
MISKHRRLYAAVCRAVERLICPAEPGVPRRPILRLEALEERCTPTTSFLNTPLLSDLPGVAQARDPNLVNPFGFVVGPGDFGIAAADNGAGQSEVIGPDGQPFPEAVSITIPGGKPTGVALAGFGNRRTDFLVTDGTNTLPSELLFGSGTGAISGWNPGVGGIIPGVGKLDISPNAEVGFQATDGAIYKGLALAQVQGANFLYATDFHNGKIDVIDGQLHKVALGAGGFETFTDPNLPRGFAPFNIAALNGKLYVTYAQQDAQAVNDVAGPGHGFIDVFETNGHFDGRLVSGGDLNSPWGLALAPAGFGDFGNTLLVGSSGDGEIHAYDPTTGVERGVLNDSTGGPLVIDGLRALGFGNGNGTGGANTLFYDAGPSQGAHGLFGTITVPVTDPNGPGVTILENSLSTDVLEGGGPATYSIVLKTVPTANVTVTLTPDPQLHLSATTLVFTPINWADPQTVTVSAPDDFIVQGSSHNVLITHSARSADTNFNNIAIAPLTVNITDRDVPGVDVTQGGGLTVVTEGGAGGSFTVTLFSKPTAPVTVSLTPDSPLNLSATTLLFTPANWNVAQMVTVHAPDDHLVQGLHTINITQAVTSNDPIYNGIRAGAIPITVVDTDRRPGAVFVLGPDNQVHEQKLDANGNSASAYFLAAPGAVRTLLVGHDANNLPEVFVIGLDQQLYALHIDAAGNPVGGYTLVAPGRISSAVLTYDVMNRPELFALGLDNQVYAVHFDVNGQATSGYILTNPGQVLALAAGRDASNHPEVFVIGLDSQVYSAKLDAQGNPVSGYVLTHPGQVKSLAVGNDGNGNPELFVLGLDSQVYAQKLDAEGSSVGGYFLTARGVVVSLLVGHDATDRPELFVQGLDGQVYGQTLDATGTTSTGYVLTHRGQVKATTLTYDPQGHPELFVIGLDDQVYGQKLDASGHSISGYFFTQPGKVQAVRATS